MSVNPSGSALPARDVDEPGQAAQQRVAVRVAEVERAAEHQRVLRLGPGAEHLVAAVGVVVQVHRRPRGRGEVVGERVGVAVGKDDTSPARTSTAVSSPSTVR